MQIDTKYIVRHKMFECQKLNDLNMTNQKILNLIDLEIQRTEVDNFDSSNVKWPRCYNIIFIRKTIEKFQIISKIP